MHEEGGSVNVGCVGNRGLPDHDCIGLRLPRMSQKLALFCPWNVAGSVIADPVRRPSTYNSRSKPVGVADGPICKKSAIGITGHSQPLRIHTVVLQRVVDTSHYILQVPVAPSTPSSPLELLTV